MRLGIGIAQGIALALDLPVVAVSTLQVLALRAPADADKVLASIDARMGEVYAGAFARCADGVQLLDDERVCAPEAVTLPDDDAGWFAVGTGLAAVEGQLQRSLDTRLAGVDASALPHAADLLELALPAFAGGQVLAPERIEPAYLRDNVALTLEQQRAARAAR